ncbi:metal-dependent hydrolase, partial [Salmonella enterica subsp. enterica serovar Poona]
MSWRFIDTHCHFDFPPFTGDERASIQRACEAGVGKIIVPATEAAHFPRVLALAARFPSLYAARGLHPIVIARHAEDDPARRAPALALRPAGVA